MLICANPSSIPSAKIVDGYDDLMPEPVLTEKEVDEMIAYLKTIK